MSYTSLKYHIVFSTKARRALLDEKIMQRLSQYLGGITREMKGCLLAANGPEDHLHLAVVMNPETAITDFIRTLKANSSKWIHKTFSNLANFAWQDGYSAFTVSHSVIPQVIKYIQNQREHHKKMTFQEELVALLKRHNIEYDQRYIIG